MKLRNSVISIGLASLLIGCGSDGDSGIDSRGVNTEGGSLMLNNELIYNQVIEAKTKEAVMPYIKSKFGGQKPTEQNVKDIKTAVDNAKSTHSDKNPQAVTAAVINKVIAIASSNPAGIKDITVTEQDIVDADIPSLAALDVANSFDVNLTAAIDVMKTANWADPKDTEFRYLSSKNGKLIGGTKEHNGLAVIDLAEKTLNFTAASVLTDCGHGVLSPSVDASSGASEPSMQGATLTSDGSSVYFNVPEKGDKSNANILGLFRADVAADGSIATTETDLPNGDGKIIVSNGDRLNLNIAKFALANDDSKVVVYDEEKNLRLYSADLATELGKTDDVSVDALTGVAVSATNVYTATSTAITKRAISGALATTGTIEIGFAADKMIINADASKMIAFTYGTGTTNIAVVDLSNDSVINKGSIAFESDGAAVSPDFKQMALFGHEEKTTNIINLTVKGLSTQGRYDKPSRGGTFIDNDKLAITDGKHKIFILNVATTTDNNTLKEKMAAGLASLTKDAVSIKPLDTVTSNLVLPPKYEIIDIAWESTLPTGVLSTIDGSVTRGAADVSGKLSATLSSTFRDVVESQKKDFNVTVRKAIPISQVTSTVSVNDMRGGFVSASPDGTKVVSANREGKEGGLFVLDSSSGNLEFSIGNMTTGYHKFGEEEDALALEYTKDNQVVAVTDKNIYRYTVGATLAESQKITPSDKITGAVFNADNTKLAVLVKVPDGNYTTKIYDIDDAGVVSDTQADVAMELASYGREMAINNDASIIFTKDNKNTIHAQNGATHTSNPIGERVRGLFYVGGKVVATNSNGVLFAMNDNLSTKDSYYTGHNGRGYGMKEVGGKIFAFLYAKNTEDSGVAILNSTTFEEESFISSERAYKGTVSPDGKNVYFFSYTTPRGLSYVNLP